MSDPQLDLETVVRRNHPTAVAGAIQPDTAADNTRVTLSFGADDGSPTQPPPTDTKPVASPETGSHPRRSSNHWGGARR
jgi:hypothetical protein